MERKIEKFNQSCIFKRLICEDVKAQSVIKKIIKEGLSIKLSENCSRLVYISFDEMNKLEYEMEILRRKHRDLNIDLMEQMFIECSNQFEEQLNDLASLDVLDTEELHLKKEIVKNLVEIYDKRTNLQLERQKNNSRNEKNDFIFAKCYQEYKKISKGLIHKVFSPELINSWESIFNVNNQTYWSTQRRFSN